MKKKLYHYEETNKRDWCFLPTIELFLYGKKSWDIELRFLCFKLILWTQPDFNPKPDYSWIFEDNREYDESRDLPFSEVK